MSATPAPWTATWRTNPDATHTLIIVGPGADNGQSHTVAELHSCDDGTHPDRAWADGQLIVRLRNEAVTGSSSRAQELPTVVCLCGSTRFYDAFQEANYAETMAGRIVLSVGFYPHSKAEHGHGEGVGHDSAEKVALDELHNRKIDLADEVLVLNVGGYVGSSTRSEIAYAVEHGKRLRWLEHPSGALLAQVGAVTSR